MPGISVLGQLRQEFEASLETVRLFLRKIARELAEANTEESVKWFSGQRHLPLSLSLISDSS